MMNPPTDTSTARTGTPAAPTPPTDRRRLVIEGLTKVIDAAIPVIAFLVVHALVGPFAAVAAALAGGGAVALFRVVRGDSLKAVGLALAVVLVHGLFVLLTGDGRDFFLPALLLNVVLAVAAAGSLVVRRPLTGPAARYALGERPGWHRDPVRLRLHDRMTFMWLGLAALHLVVWVPLYLQNNVAMLGITAVVLGKPLSVVCLFVSWRVLRQRPAAA